MQIQRRDWSCTACGSERDVAAVEGQLCSMLAQVGRRAGTRPDMRQVADAASKAGSQPLVDPWGMQVLAVRHALLAFASFACCSWTAGEAAPRGLGRSASAGASHSPLPRCLRPKSGVPCRWIRPPLAALLLPPPDSFVSHATPPWLIPQGIKSAPPPSPSLLEQAVEGYQLQDLRCCKCGTVASNHLQRSCDVCGGHLRGTQAQVGLDARGGGGRGGTLYFLGGVSVTTCQALKPSTPGA